MSESRVNIMFPMSTRFPIEGSMQDFNYVFTNCMELTVELSCNKKPPAGRLQVIFLYMSHNYWEMLNRWLG